ncbi:MAG: hypothetical protein HY329_21875 [Chloroflexi bacterium]|nr:hypothetical protein [Chloroflexota bacterium]
MIGELAQALQSRLLLGCAVVALLSLLTMVRVYAEPAEAQASDVWYSYQCSVGFDFTARVQPSRFYPSTELRPQQLLRTQLPVNPPVYRRVLISRFADALEIRIPYSFRGDRPGPIKARLRVDGAMLMPGVWQTTVEWVAPKDLDTAGPRFEGVETFRIDVRQLLQEIEINRTQYNLAAEPLELTINPVLEVQVDGQRQPVQVTNNPEFRMGVRSQTIEIDDAREARSERVLSSTQTVPTTLSLFGSDVPIASLRWIASVSLVASLTPIAAAWVRRRKSGEAALLEKLGPALVPARMFTPPSGTAVAEVATAKQLVDLHTQTERPIIQAGNVYYLLDGTTCYRYVLPTDKDSWVGATTAQNKIEQFTTAIRAETLTIEQRTTEVFVHSPADLLQVHLRTGRPLLRTDIGYHILDDSVCYTYLLQESPAPLRWD